ncbi:MAG: GAF domain-containing protein [Acutalibacter sp.]|jgi:signal transduction protein with GAF and PtsI domain
MSLASGEGIAGTVVQEGKTTVVKDCQSDPRWAGRFDEATGFVTRSMICVPLVNKYEVIGCIQIINKRDGSLYNDEDVSLCENLAMLTTISGLMGCVALLIISFSMKFGNEDSSVVQFNKYFLYDNRLVVDSSQGSVEEYAQILDDNGVEYMLIQNQLENFRVDGGDWDTSHVMVADNF